MPRCLMTIMPTTRRNHLTSHRLCVRLELLEWFKASNLARAAALNNLPLLKLLLTSLTPDIRNDSTLHRLPDAKKGLEAFITRCGLPYLDVLQAILHGIINELLLLGWLVILPL